MTKSEVIENEARYKEIGFMCGLEIHQRLSTTHKLFCSCPTTLANGQGIVADISRYQRAVAGELGNIDRSAEFEESKKRKFVYQVHDKNTCLVDIDEEPPHSLNNEALGVALALANSMNMKIIDELQPMRKEVVDGSDPSAFQRTTLVGVNGEIKVDGYAIIMPTLFLEEESCGIISTTEDGIVYDTDRIGIPLLEIDTDPYIPTPKAAKAIALYVGTLLRVSGKVQRGIGSIRQDVNVSIKGGNRVEIKGLQEVDKIDKFIENEITRQQRLLEIRETLKERGASVGPHVNLSEVFKKSSVKIVTNHLDKKGIAIGFKLVGFRGLLGKEINPDRRLGSEISDYAKMAKVNGLIHSDENLNAYGFTEKELLEIKKHLKMNSDDSFIIIAGGKKEAEQAVQFALERAKYALVGVPLETRGVQNNDNCTTKFLRPLPGGSRMYPETDARPILIKKEQIDSVKTPDIEKEKKALYSKIENKEIADQLLLSIRLPLYRNIIASSKADPNFVANILIQKFTELKRGGFNVDSIDEKRLVDVFTIYKKGEIAKQAVEELLKELSLSNESVANIIKTKRLGKISGEKLEELVEHTMREIKDPSNVNELRAALMAKCRLNVDGSELNELLSKKKKTK